MAAIALLVAIEAVREVPAGATHYVWRVPFGTWGVAEIQKRFDRMWAWPCLLGGDVVILQPASPEAVVCGRTDSGAHGFEQVARAQRSSRLPNVVAFVVTLGIVTALPIGAYRYGVAGLLLACCTFVNLWLLTSILISMREGWRGHKETLQQPSPRIVLGSPLALLTIAGSSIERTVLGEPAWVIARGLLSEDTLAAFLRPTWYDASMGEPSASSTQLEQAILASFSTSELSSLLDQTPKGVQVGERYCPRCGAAFVPGVERCTDCAECPPLIPA
jgi:hypothetical protein